VPLLLRKSRAQARIEGWDASGWSEDDYAVVDETRVVGRIYREIHPRRTQVEMVPANRAGAASEQRLADTLDEAKAVFKRRKGEVIGHAMFFT
jgi:hypothetical protein